jgi:hypothetical protein
MLGFQLISLVPEEAPSADSYWTPSFHTSSLFFPWDTSKFKAKSLDTYNATKN